MPRTLAFGDIHGCLAHLDALLDAVAPRKKDHLIFLGDYIDRGPNSNGVLKRLLQLSRSHTCTFLMGNHEEMMLAARSEHLALVEWLLNGGDATLMSYNGVRGNFHDVPTEHWAFMEKTTLPYLETDTHLFVHANVDPHLPMADQPHAMLRWERCDDSRPHDSGKRIICGHTPQRTGLPLVRDHLVCIDTCAFTPGGLLTCLDVTAGRYIQSNAQGHTRRGDLADLLES